MCAVGVHKNPETGSRTTETNGRATNHLYRRYPHQHMAQEHTLTLVFLLENLGFVINYPSVSWNPHSR
jgi:hypothetical protein